MHLCVWLAATSVHRRSPTHLPYQLRSTSTCVTAGCAYKYRSTWKVVAAGVLFLDTLSPSPCEGFAGQFEAASSPLGCCTQSMFNRIATRLHSTHSFVGELRAKTRQVRAHPQRVPERTATPVRLLSPLIDEQMAGRAGGAAWRRSMGSTEDMHTARAPLSFSSFSPFGSRGVSITNAASAVRATCRQRGAACAQRVSRGRRARARAGTRLPC